MQTPSSSMAPPSATLGPTTALVGQPAPHTPDVAQLIAAHPSAVVALAVVLAVTSATASATAKLGEDDMRRLERDRPRTAGLIYLARGAGFLVHWIARGVLLLLAPPLARWVFGTGEDSGGGEGATRGSKGGGS